MIGEKFERWTVLEKVRGNAKGYARVKCICECGKIKEVSVVNIKKGLSKSCGCLKRGRQHSDREHDRSLAFAKDIYQNLKDRHRSKGFGHDLISPEEVKSLIFSPCFYCGVEHSNSRLSRHPAIRMYYNGIDRIDSSKGYVYGNVRTCCKYCNAFKSDRSEKDFYEHIERLVNNFKK